MDEHYVQYLLDLMYKTHPNLTDEPAIRFWVQYQHVRRLQ